MTVERVTDLVRYRTIADRETARHQGMTDLQVDAALGYARDRRTIFATQQHPPLTVANGLRAVPPGAEATYSFAYEDTDMPSGMTCREWVRAGRPVNETAPAAEATAPAPRPEGNKPMGAAHLTVVRGAQADWYDTRGHVADLVTHLLDTAAIRPDQVGEVIEHPWKWTLEFDAMRAAEAELDQPWGGDAA